MIRVEFYDSPAGGTSRAYLGEGPCKQDYGQKVDAASVLHVMLDGEILATLDAAAQCWRLTEDDRTFRRVLVAVEPPPTRKT